MYHCAIFKINLNLSTVAVDYFVKDKRECNLVQKCHIYMLLKIFNRKNCDKDMVLFIWKFIYLFESFFFFYTKVYGNWEENKYREN